MRKLLFILIVFTSFLLLTSFVSASPLEDFIAWIYKTFGIAPTRTYSPLGIVPAAEENATCTDSDGGKNYYVKGSTARCVSTDDIGECVETEDCCAQSSYSPDCVNESEYVAERFCREDNHIDTEIFKCPNGCKEGACVLPSYLFVVDDESPPEDVVIITDIISEVEDKIAGDYKILLNSEVTRDVLDYRITTFVYKKQALIIIGANSPPEQVVVATDISEALKEKHGIDAVLKLSSEIKHDDLRKEIEEALPDLIVVGIQFNPPQPIVSQKINVTFSVKNIGKAIAEGDIRLQVHVTKSDGSEVEDGDTSGAMIFFRDIQPEQTVSGSSKFVYYHPGEKVFTATIDSNDRIVEFNETNNVMIKNVYVSPTVIPCGNGVCEAGETSDNCCFDCGCPSGYNCVREVNGTADATEPVRYGEYSLYSDLGSNDAWARISIKDVTGAVVETLIINQDQILFSTRTGLEIEVIDVRALQDGTIIGVNLRVGPISLYGTATETTPVNYDDYSIYATLGSDDEWVELRINDKTGSTVDTLIVNKGEMVISLSTGLSIKLLEVDALADGAVIEAKLDILSLERWKCTFTGISCSGFCKSHDYEYGECKESCSGNEIDVGTEYCPQLKNQTYLHCCCGKGVTTTTTTTPTTTTTIGIFFRRADLGSEFWENETDTATCDNPTDCVYHGVCYPEGSYVFNYKHFRASKIVDITEVCSNGVWYDCFSDEDCKICSYCTEDHVCYSNIGYKGICGNKHLGLKWDCDIISNPIWPDFGCCPKDCGTKHDHSFAVFVGTSGKSSSLGSSISDFTVEDLGDSFFIDLKDYNIMLPKNNDIRIVKDGQTLTLTQRDLEEESRKKILVQYNPPIKSGITPFLTNLPIGYEEALLQISSEASEYDGKIVKRNDKIKTYVIEAPSTKIKSLMNTLKAKGYKAYENLKFNISLDVSVPLIGADKVWESGFTGKDVNVGILDTGISFEHPDVKDRILKVEDWVNESFHLSVYDVICRNAEMINKTFVVDNTFKGKSLIIWKGMYGWAGGPINCEPYWIDTSISNFDIYLYDQDHNLLGKSTHKDLPYEGVYLESVPEDVEKLIITVNSTGEYHTCRWWWPGGGWWEIGDTWLVFASYTSHIHGIFDTELTTQPPGAPDSINGIWKKGYVYFPDVGDVSAVLSNVQVDHRHSLPQYIYDYVSLDMDGDSYYELGLSQPQAGIHEDHKGDLLKRKGFNFFTDLYTFCVGHGSETLNGKQMNFALQYGFPPFPPFYDIEPIIKGLDFHGHGTHVASTAVGSGAASDSKYTGVAPDANLIIGKVLNRRGSGYWSDVNDAIIWASDNGADVISMSFGAKAGDYDPLLCEEGPLYDAISYAVDRNVTVVTAAGNTGPSSSTIDLPGCIDKVITVGASDDRDLIASFSSRGPAPDGSIKPDLVAPGVKIIAARAFYTNLLSGEKEWTSMGRTINEYYTEASGTSMATPHVSGSVALLKEKNPNLTPQEIKNILMNVAVDLGYDPNTQGSGRINVTKAVEAVS